MDASKINGPGERAQVEQQAVAPADSDAIIAAIHREETPGILADLHAKLAERAA